MYVSVRRIDRVNVYGGAGPDSAEDAVDYLAVGDGEGP